MNIHIIHRVEKRLEKLKINFFIENSSFLAENSINSLTF